MAEEQPDPYSGWRADFDKEVDKVMSKSASTPISPVRDALADFDDWWRGEVPDTGLEPGVSIEALQTNKEFEISRDETRMLKQEIERLRSEPDGRSMDTLQRRLENLMEERERLREELQTKTARTEQENEDLRGRNARLEQDLADLQIKLSRDRDAFEARIRQLEERGTRLEEQLRDGKENRQFMESEHHRKSARIKELEGLLVEIGREKKDLEREAHELTRADDEIKRTLAGKENERAALESAAAELRDQATELRERLIKSSKALDTDRSTGRSELNKITRQSEELESRLIAGQRESEMKIRETTRYLEMKIRETHDENKEQFGRFRELLDALVRFRGTPR